MEPSLHVIIDSDADPQRVVDLLVAMNDVYSALSGGDELVIRKASDMDGVIIREGDPDDDLSQNEIDYINSSLGNCPTCFTGDLIGGPRGGTAQNVRCNQCWSEFNLFLYVGNPAQFVIGAQHLPMLGDEPYQLASLRSHWGKLDDSPPPGITVEQWAALQAEATQALDRLTHDDDEGSQAAAGE